MRGLGAMTVSSIEVTAGSGTHLWTDARTVSAVSRHAQFTLPAPPVYPSYSALASIITTATSAAHVLQIMGDGTNYSRLFRFEICMTDDIPAAASAFQMHLYRLSTAGTGGSALNGQPYDAGDATYGGGVMTLPTVKGTEGIGLNLYMTIPLPSAQPFISRYVWEAQSRSKEIIFGTSTANGIAFKIVTGLASATIQIMAEFYVTSFL